jgi:predicted dehydrogenase
MSYHRLKNLRIGVVGRSGHAGRLINILDKKKINIVSYHPKTKFMQNDNLIYTANFNEILNCDGVIISCPTFLHWHYLNKLKQYKGHILVEKPAVSNKSQAKLLIPFIKKYKLKLNINFNLRNSELFNIVKKIIKNNKSFGKVISCSIFSSHGLAFKKKYYSNWRSKKELSKGIIEVDTVHYIDLAIALFGNLLDYKLIARNYASNKKTNNNDTVALLLETKKIPVTIFNSYSSPFFFKMIIFGTNGIIEYDGKNIIYKYPRDTFDKSERFISPKIKQKYNIRFDKMWKESLVSSINGFIYKIKKNNKTKYKILTQHMDAVSPGLNLR